MKPTISVAALALVGVLGATVLSVFAAGGSVAPIVDVQTGYLIGGSRDGKWLSDKDTARALKGGEPYRVYSSNSRLGDTTGSKTRTDEAPCNETHWVSLQRNYNGALAVGGKWNVFPRRYRAQAVNQKTYRDEVVRILRQKGIRNPNVKIEQLWRVDLDGDGAEEVLLSATNYQGLKNGQGGISSHSRAGEYSLVLLRKVVKGKVQTTLVEGDFHVQNKTFNAPSYYRLIGVYDLNGDGRLEFVVRSGYYEGDAMSVYALEDAKPREVLVSGCGA